MIVVVPTVKHSGSHTVLNSFLEYGFEQRPLKGFDQSATEKVVLMDHVIWVKEERMLDIAAAADHVVIPIRHPRLVAYSWVSQGEELVPDFFQMYKSLVPFVELPNALTLPLGVTNRLYADRIKEATGVRIDTSRMDRSIAGSGNMTPEDPRIEQMLGRVANDDVNDLYERLEYVQKAMNPETRPKPGRPKKTVEKAAAAPKKKRGRPKKKAAPKKQEEAAEKLEID